MRLNDGQIVSLVSERMRRGVGRCVAGAAGRAALKTIKLKVGKKISLAFITTLFTFEFRISISHLRHD